MLLYCPCGCVGSSNRSPISFDPLENWSAEKQVPGDSGGVQSWTSSTEQGVIKRRQRKNDQGTHGMSSMTPWGHSQKNVSMSVINRSSEWLFSHKTLFVQLISDQFLRSLTNKQKKKKLWKIYRYALWFLPVCISIEFSALSPISCSSVIRDLTTCVRKGYNGLKNCAKNCRFPIQWGVHWRAASESWRIWNPR